MNVETAYVQYPHVCFYCRLPNQPALDMQRPDEDARNPNGYIEFLYLCGTCTLHAARTVLPLMGYMAIESDIIAKLEAEIATLRGEADEALAERDRALAARDALVASYGVPAEPEPQPEPPVEGRSSRKGAKVQSAA